MPVLLVQSEEADPKYRRPQHSGLMHDSNTELNNLKTNHPNSRVGIPSADGLHLLQAQLQAIPPLPSNPQEPRPAGQGNLAARFLQIIKPHSKLASVQGWTAKITLPEGSSIHSACPSNMTARKADGVLSMIAFSFFKALSTIVSA